MIADDKVVQEEMHKRSPATRSYTQMQARVLFEQNGFENIELFRAFTHEYAKRDDEVFVIIGQKSNRA